VDYSGDGKPATKYSEVVPAAAVAVAAAAVGLASFEKGRTANSVVVRAGPALLLN